MDNLMKYLSIGLASLLVILVIYCLYLRNGRDNAVNNLNSANSEINRILQVNNNLSSSIELLESQAKQNRHYINDLEQKRLATQQQANQLTQQFRRQQHENQTISTWANQSLPNGLY